jgi:hypothetical protein
VANWIALKSFVLEFTSEHRVCDASIRKAFKKSPSPPHGWLFGCAQYVGTQTHPQYYVQVSQLMHPGQQVVDKNPRRGIVKVMFEFDGLLFYSIGVNTPPLIKEAVPNVSDHFERHAVRGIWPKDGDSKALANLAADDVVIEYMMHSHDSIYGHGPFSDLPLDDDLARLGRQLLANGLREIDLRTMLNRPS